MPMPVALPVVSLALMVPVAVLVIVVLPAFVVAIEMTGYVAVPTANILALLVRELEPVPVWLRTTAGPTTLVPVCPTVPAFITMVRLPKPDADELMPAKLFVLLRTFPPLIVISVLPSTADVWIASLPVAVTPDDVTLTGVEPVAVTTVAAAAGCAASITAASPVVASHAARLMRLPFVLIDSLMVYSPLTNSS